MKMLAGVIIGAVAGGSLGVLWMCLVIAGKKEDEWMEKMTEKTGGEHTEKKKDKEGEG